MSDLTPPDHMFGDQAATVTSPRGAGQGTMIEQARAIADVRAAIMIAREDPRNEDQCIAEMRRACGMKEMADIAFFRVQRGKNEDGTPNMVTGPTIDLANELSRCWRNINSGHKELLRDDLHGQSEVLAYAWDIEKNIRREQTIIVPHKRGKYQVKDTQGIREVIAGVAARVEREMIFRVLPTWFRVQAVDLCYEVLAAGDGKPIEQRIADCKAVFYGIDVMADQLERKIGRPASAWTPEDIAILTVVYKSIRRGQSQVADEFPAAQVQRQPSEVADLEAKLNKPKEEPAKTEKTEPEADKVKDDTSASPYAPIAAKEYKAVAPWAADVAALVGALTTVADVEAMKADPSYKDRIAAAHDKAGKIALELEDKIEDRITFLMAQAREKEAGNAD